MHPLKITQINLSLFNLNITFFNCSIHFTCSYKHINVPQTWEPPCVQSCRPCQSLSRTESPWPPTVNVHREGKKQITMKLCFTVLTFSSTWCSHFRTWRLIFLHTRQMQISCLFWRTTDTVDWLFNPSNCSLPVTAYLAAKSWRNYLDISLAMKE